MNCPKCQTQNPEGARFCSNCGTALAVACSKCGAALQPGAKFCHNCGQPVAETQAASPAAPKSQGAEQGAPTATSLERYIPKELLNKLEAARQSGMMEGERRVVTILFCDVQGSTLAASTMDPEEWAEIINGAFEPMIRPVYRYEGIVARLMGDGLLAFFGAPISHEDDPQRAILAGLEIQREISAYAQGVKARWGIDFNVRVGINTGLVVVGAMGSDLRVEYTALGDAINIAARMEQTARPGSVQISEQTQRLVAPLFDFERIEGLEVKGRSEPVTAFRVLSRKRDPSSLRGIAGLYAPLIGRSDETEALEAAFSELSQGRGQIVSVIAEAGLGKSRLVSEARGVMLADPALNLHWVEGRTLSYETSLPFAPFINLFNGYFNLQAFDDPRSQYQRIKECLERAPSNTNGDPGPFLATLLGVELEVELAERVKYLEPPQLRGLIFAHISAWLESLLADQPVVIFIDDLHWADPTSLELLESLLPLTDRSALMIITAFRPRQSESSWKYHQKAERDFNQRYKVITLKPLDEGQSRDLVANLLQIEDLPEYIRRKILEKAEGNPFFVEEIIRSLLDSGLVVRVDDHWRATKEIQKIVLPDTLAGVITARLDRLDEPTRHIIQSAAVLGREFSSAVLGDIVETSAQLAPALAELERRELVLEKNGLNQRKFSFKHVLTQEAAYDSILLSNRRELHRRAADSLIARSPEASPDIARHLLEARLAARAVPYLVQSGDRAARAYATEEAIAYYRQALELQDAIPEAAQLRKAYEGLGAALDFANRIEESQANYQEMLNQAEAHGDIPTQISALNKIAGLVALRLGQFPEAEKLLARVDRLASEFNDNSGIVETSLIRCQMCTIQADFDAVVEHMDHFIRVGHENYSPEYVVVGLEHMANSLIYLTHYDEAFEKAIEGLQVAREIGNRQVEAALLCEAVPFCQIRNGDFAAARASMQEGLEIARRIGSLASQAMGGYLLAEIARWEGRYEEALQHGMQALEAVLPIEPFMPFYVVPVLGSLGMIYLEISEKFTDRIGEFHLHALRLLEFAREQRIGAGSAWADLGLCALALGDLKVAEQAIEQGLTYPNIFMRMERPRHLAGAALLAIQRGDPKLAIEKIGEARAFVLERKMRQLYPLVSLVEGKALKAKGELDAAALALERAEEEARELGMRSLIWQACAEAASVFAASGRMDEAESKRAAARAMVAEIADLFQDQTLRAAYLENVMGKVG